jgi:hypothetical protein
MRELIQHVTSIEGELTPAFVERTVWKFFRGMERSRGVGALRFVLHLLGDLAQRSEEIAWAYARLKPTLLDAVERTPSLRFLDGG